MQDPAAHGLIPRGIPPSITRYAARLRGLVLRARMPAWERQDRRMRPPGRPSALGTAAACQLGICDDQVLCAVPLLCQPEQRRVIGRRNKRSRFGSTWSLACELVSRVLRAENQIDA